MKKIFFFMMTFLINGYFNQTWAENPKLKKTPKSYAECSRQGGTTDLVYEDVNGKRCLIRATCNIDQANFQIKTREEFEGKCVTSEKLADFILYPEKYQKRGDEQYIYDVDCKSGKCDRNTLEFDGGTGQVTYTADISRSNACHKKCMPLFEAQAKGRRGSKHKQKKCSKCLMKYSQSQCLLGGSSPSTCVNFNQRGGGSPARIIIDDGSVDCSAGSSIYRCVPERDVTRFLDRDVDDCFGCKRGGRGRDRSRRGGRHNPFFWGAISSIAQTGAGYLINKKYAEACPLQAEAYYGSVNTYNENITAKNLQQSSTSDYLTGKLMKPKQFDCNGQSHRQFAGFRGQGNGGGFGYNPWFGNSFNGARQGFGGINPYGGIGSMGGGIYVGGNFQSPFRQGRPNGHFQGGQQGWRSGMNGHPGGYGWNNNFGGGVGGYYNAQLGGGYNGSGINPYTNGQYGAGGYGGGYTGGYGQYGNGSQRGQFGGQQGRGMSSRNFNDPSRAWSFQNMATQRDLQNYQNNHYNGSSAFGYGGNYQHCQSPFGC